jgi:DNA-binding CsgD family transcriptional regulator
MKLVDYISKHRYFGKKYDFSKVLDLVKSGQSDKEIANVIGCHPWTVSRYRIKNGLKQRTGPKTKIDYNKVLELYKSGKTDKEIAIFFKCDYRTISNWRIKNNLPPSWIYITQNYNNVVEVEA